MAKNFIVDNNSRTITGTLNLDTMTVEGFVDSEPREVTLKELLERFDGEEISIKVAISSKV